MICAYCNNPIDVKHDNFVCFANETDLHLACYEQRDKERKHGSINGDIQPS